MRTTAALRLLLFSFTLLIFSRAAPAQISLGISVNFGPPALPVYEQPICPAEGYLWVPGYWAYDNDYGYYWVPGTWVEAPQVGFLWTPGYWGWGGNAFLFHQGYWGPHVGFYGGIAYGFGYGGNGYEGGRWEGGHFSYNTEVNHINTTIIHNTYNVHVTNITENHISYNGGQGGVSARATAQEESYQRERHVGPVAAQMQHVQMARGNPELRASANHGVPAVAATARPGDFRTGVVASRQAGGEYKAPPARASHASELKPHTFTPPNSGNAAADNKYKQQQSALAARQAQDHQRLQQQQEQQHQQATAKNYNDAQKARLEQQHVQQTQHVEQKHAVQQQHLERHQPAPRPESRPQPEKPR